MILLEITDESGITHYDILGLTPKDLEGLDDRKIASKVRTAANNAKRPYNLAVKKGDAAAAEKTVQINAAEAALKKREAREQYEKDLQSGKSAALEILRIRPVAPPFFHDRNVRFSVIERLLREIEGSGNVHNEVPGITPDRANITHYEILGITPRDLEGLDDLQIAKKLLRAANNARYPYVEAARKGDAAALERITRINNAQTVLKYRERREEYNNRL